MGPDELAPLCSQEGIDFVKHFSYIPWEESTGKKILITGSYYFLGAIKSRLVR
jgi:hypothetical protein